MGVARDEERLYEGPPHRWALPLGARPLSFLLFAFASTVVVIELLFVAVELLVYGYILPPTARAFAVWGIVLLAAANTKSLVLALRRQANEPLGGALDFILDRLWLAHFWLNPLGLFSLGLFLLFAPRVQPPFYYIAYGVLLWQTATGLMGREAIPTPVRAEDPPRVARAAHHQPAIFVLLAVLLVAGFVDSLFP